MKAFATQDSRRAGGPIVNSALMLAPLGSAMCHLLRRLIQEINPAGLRARSNGRAKMASGQERERKSVSGATFDAEAHLSEVEHNYFPRHTS